MPLRKSGLILLKGAKRKKMFSNTNKKQGLENPLTTIATFIMIFVAFNPDFSNNSVLWWICVGAFFLVFIIEQKELYMDSGYVLWIILFVLFSAASYLWAVSTSAVIGQLKSMIVYVFLLAVLCSVVRTKKDINRLLNIIVLVSLCNAIYLLITNAEILFSQVQENQNEEIVRLGAQGNWNANIIGMTMAISSIILLYLLSQRQGKKWYYILGIIFLVFVSFLTGSRKAFLVVLLGISLYLMLSVKKNKKLTVLFIIAFSIIAVYYLVMYNPFLYSILGCRIEGLFASLTGVGTVDSSTIKRELYIKAGLQVFRDNFLVGCGLDCFRLLNLNITDNAMYAHNNYVELLADLGIVGTLIYYSIHIIIFSRLFKNYKKGGLLTKLVLVFMILIMIVDYGSVNYNSLLFNCILLISFTWTKLIQKEN